MKCLILAAGYATRLYPLTKNFPKPLLKVGDKTILDWLIDDLEKSNKIDEYIVISNHKFANIFKEWGYRKSKKITIIDDGTLDNETRLGAVKDILFAVKKLKIKDDALVIAGDNVLDFSLTKFIDYAIEKNASCVLKYEEKERVKLSKSGVLEVDNEDKVLSMEEKPAEPKTNWCCPPFYFYKSYDLGKIERAIEEGCGVDAPGSFIAWLSKETTVYAMEMPGKRYDIGNLKSYEKVKKEYVGTK